MKVHIKDLAKLAFIYCVTYTTMRSLFLAVVGSMAHMFFLAMMFFLIICYFISYKRMCVKIRKKPFYACMLVYIIYIAFNIIFNRYSGFYGVYEYIFFICMFFAMLFLLNYHPIEKLLIIYEISGVIIAFEAIWEFATGRILFRNYQYAQLIRRAFGFIGSPLTLGMIMACISLIAIYMGKHKKRSHYLIAVLTFIALLCTQSRGPLVGFLAGVCVMYLLDSDGKETINRKTKKILSLIGIALLVLLLMVVLSRYIPFVETIYNRVLTIFEWESTNKVNFYRKSLWLYSLELFSRKPFIGYGVSSTGSHGTTGIITESGVLKKLVETGLIGFVLYYSMMVGSIYRNAKKHLKNNSGYTALAVGVIVSIFVENIVMQVVESVGVYMILMLFVAYLFLPIEMTQNERSGFIDRKKFIKIRFFANSHLYRRIIRFLFIRDQNNVK